MNTSKKKTSAYDAFSAVDALVSKAVLGSDGAASWQEFKSSTKDKSRGIAPHLPLKKTDKLSGVKSIEDERRQEQRIREMNDEMPMGSGYTVFKRKNTQEDAAERKRRKRITERKRPDDKVYFMKSDTFAGWKEDYIFTTRNGNTGYYWDGMDSVKTLNAEEQDTITGVEDKKDPEKPALSKKKKAKGKNKEYPQDHLESSTNAPQLPEGWASAIDPTTGRLYYYNVVLSKTVWDLPKIDGDEHETKRSDAEKSLPQGWEMAKDPSTGRPYFNNRSLNITSWKRPE